MLFWSTFDESTGVKTSFSVSKLELVWCALRERERYLTVFLVRFDLEIYLYSSTATQKMKYTPPPQKKKEKCTHACEQWISLLLWGMHGGVSKCNICSDTKSHMAFVV